MAVQGLDFPHKPHYNYFFLQKLKDPMNNKIETGIHGRSPSQEAIGKHPLPKEAREHMSPLRSVLSHVTNPENVGPITEGRMCGDGRYEGLDGKFARFGADGGYVLGLLSLNKTLDLGLKPTQIVDAVVQASEGKFTIHTDDHAEKDAHEQQDATKIGCGHLAKATLPENASNYLVDPADVKEVIAYMRQLAAINPDKVEIEELHGPHREKGVIFNVGETNKIRHGVKDNDQFFMVNVPHDAQYSEELLQRLQQQNPALQNVTYEQFSGRLAQQTETTAKILAKGLPVFRVNVDRDFPLVESAGAI